MAKQVEVGQVRHYKPWNCPVYITGGDLEIGGRVSNFWDFLQVKKDGTLGRGSGDYDNGPFGKVYKAAITTTVRIKEWTK